MKKITALFIVWLYSIVFVLNPAALTFAQEKYVNEIPEEYNLYKVIEDIVLDGHMKINTGAIIYGKESDEGKVIVQFNDSYETVNKTLLQEVVLKEEYIPEFKKYSKDSDYAVGNFKLGNELYFKDSALVEFLSDYEYLLDEKGNTIIGNVEFNFKKDSKENEQNNFLEDQNDNEGNAIDKNDGLVEENNKKDNFKVNKQESSERIDESKNDNQEKNLENENAINNQDKNKKEAATLRVSQTVEFKSSDKYFVALEDKSVYDNSTGKLVQVATLKKGQVYPRFESSPKWHRIQYGDKKLFVEKEGTKPSSAESLKNINTKLKFLDNKTFKANEDVEVYDNTSGKLIQFASINKGQNYHISNDYGGKWITIVLADRVGYIESSKVTRNYYLPFENYFKALDDVPVYDNSTGKLIEVGRLKKGESYRRYEGSNQWHKIQFNDKHLYVHKDNTIPDTGSNIKNENNKQFEKKQRKVITKHDVTVYDNSSGSLKPFGKINQGEEYFVAVDYGGKWITIVFADRIGYIKSAEVKKGFMSSDNYFKVTEKHVAVYDNRNGELVQVGGLQKGKIYPRYEASPKWHKIQFGKYKGFVKKEQTEPINGSTIKKEVNKNLNNKETTFTPKNDILVYDSKMDPFGIIKEGKEYPIALDYGGKLIYVIFADRVGFVKKSEININGYSETKYNISLNEALDMQLSVNPQTDKEYDTYVSKNYIKNSKVVASVLNVRGGPDNDYWIVGQLSKGDEVKIIRETNGWYQIEYTNTRSWVNASPSDVKYYLNPNNFINDKIQKFQFLDLARSSDVSASKLNEFLEGKGILEGKGQAFIDAGRINGINELYLVSHALLETGNGTSTLATGVKFKDEIVYNMYGIGANDGCAISCGSKRAFQERWTTPYKAIVGGAEFIGNDYIKVGQNTLYKMRWNPHSMEKNGYAYKQYATDIGWASKQIYTMYNLYQQIDSYTIYLDIPVYKNN